MSYEMEINKKIRAIKEKMAQAPSDRIRREYQRELNRLENKKEKMVMRESYYDDYDESVTLEEAMDYIDDYLYEASKEEADKYFYKSGGMYQRQGVDSNFNNYPKGDLKKMRKKMIRKGVNLENEENPGSYNTKQDANDNVARDRTITKSGPVDQTGINKYRIGRNRNDNKLQRASMQHLHDMRKAPNGKKLIETLDRHSDYIDKIISDNRQNVNKLAINDYLYDKVKSGSANQKTKDYFKNRPKISNMKASQIMKKENKKTRKLEKELGKTEESVNDLRLQVFEAYESGAISEDEKYTFLDYLNLDNYE